MTYRTMILDGSFLAFSRYQASADKMPELFIKRLQDLQLGYSPAITYVAWDTPSGAMWRRQVSSQYKAGRPSKPPGFYDALDELKDRLTRQDVTQVQSDSGEGDDVIATICWTMPGPHLVVSADKDFLQLVVDDISFLKIGPTSRIPDVEITPENLAETDIPFGSTKVRFPIAGAWMDFLALAGDKTDGVTGIKGVGAITAAAMIHACPMLVEWLAGDHPYAEESVRVEVARNDSRGKVAKAVERVIAHREALRRSVQLVELRMLDDLEMW
jgi:DNA polymerase-1